METKHILVTGQVQGVGFRWSTTRLAKQLGITGTVKNLPSGQVAIMASGDPDQLATFIAQLRQGTTPWVVITDLDITDRPAHHFRDFRIII
ncbi:acylphosphatase [Levilactobacillus enshiensis]|uniref:acylphosphatase n=1 Tax=Levilactobacillus enshiensis TaxID=2590213 RepID=UPI00117B9607|nr:acylphosphatase [Levilactobacillus enshiensis]